MLLRSSSTPLLDSWIPQSKEPIPETHLESVVPPQLRRRSVSITLCRSSSASSTNEDDSVKKMSRALSGDDLRLVCLPKKKLMDTGLFPSVPVEVEEDQDLDSTSSASSMKKLFMSSTDDGISVDAKKKELAALSGVCGGGIGRDGGGRVSGSRRDSDSNDNHEKHRIEAYYQNMIQANPENALFLVNYAKFLKEVKCDLGKAEEYCGRAILANPNDGEVLSLYASIIWNHHKDASRAESYFDQAVKAAPDDCYVMASYAKFLWDTEDEDEEEEEQEQEEEQVYGQGMNRHKNIALHLNVFNGTPLTA